MRSFIIVVAFAGFVLFSCSKNNRVGQGIITGNWELQKEVGGFAGTINYEHGEGTQLIFDDNRNFQVNYHYASTGSGTYTITESSNPGDWILILHYSSGTQTLPQRDSVRFDKNQFIILPFASCCDIPKAYYEKQP